MSSATAVPRLLLVGKDLEWSPISPELALVDPLLAEWAREQLPDTFGSAVDPWRLEPEREPVTRSLVAVEDEAAVDIETATPLPGAPRRRTRRPLARTAAFAVAFSCIVAVTLALSASQTSRELVHRGVFKPSAAGSQPADSHRRSTSTKTATSTTTASSHARATPNASGRATAAPTFAWAPQPRAIGYEVQFFKGQTRVLVRRTSEPRISLPTHWVYGGRRFSLTSGRYHWYVWAIRRSGHPGGPGVKQQKAAYASVWTLP